MSLFSMSLILLFVIREIRGCIETTTLRNNREVLLKIAGLLERRKAGFDAYAYTSNDDSESAEEPGVHGLTDEELLDWRELEDEKRRRSHEG